VIEIEGVVANVLGARELGGGMMCLELRLSPWRRIGEAAAERSVVHVAIEMDLDLADAWLRNLDVGSCVRVACSTLPETGSIGLHVVGPGQNLDIARRPEGWPRAADGRLTIGDRVRFRSGDLIGEAAVVRALAAGPSQLYTVVLDSDDTIVQTVREGLVPVVP
jgi:hypothetical protein